MRGRIKFPYASKVGGIRYAPNTPIEVDDVEMYEEKYGATVIGVYMTSEAVKKPKSTKKKTDK